MNFMDLTLKVPCTQLDWSQNEFQERWIQANLEGFYGHLDGLVQIFKECIITPKLKIRESKFPAYSRLTNLFSIH